MRPDIGSSKELEDILPFSTFAAESPRELKFDFVSRIMQHLLKPNSDAWLGRVVCHPDHPSSTKLQPGRLTCNAANEEISCVWYPCKFDNDFYVPTNETMEFTPDAEPHMRDDYMEHPTILFSPKLWQEGRIRLLGDMCSKFKDKFHALQLKSSQQKAAANATTEQTNSEPKHPGNSSISSEPKKQKAAKSSQKTPKSNALTSPKRKQHPSAKETIIGKKTSGAMKCQYNRDCTNPARYCASESSQKPTFCQLHKDNCEFDWYTLKKGRNLPAAIAPQTPPKKHTNCTTESDPDMFDDSDS